jgi:hypothetical protein
MFRASLSLLILSSALSEGLIATKELAVGVIATWIAAWFHLDRRRRRRRK